MMQASPVWLFVNANVNINVNVNVNVNVNEKVTAIANVILFVSLNIFPIKFAPSFQSSEFRAQASEFRSPEH